MSYLANTVVRYRRFALRYRTGIQDAWLLMGIVAFALAFAFEANLGGDLSRHKRIEFEEALAVSAIIVLGVITFAYRRIDEQRREINNRLVSERCAREQAHTDALTGLPNRRRFQDELKETIACPPGVDAMHAVLALDLNGFKKVNDVYGHSAGDSVLAAVAQRFASATRDCDVLARLGGDEFAVIVRHVTGRESVGEIANRLIACLEHPVESGSVSHQLGVAIGIALMPRDGTDPEILLNKADTALYQVKATRKSMAYFFGHAPEDLPGIEKGSRQA